MLIKYTDHYNSFQILKKVTDSDIVFTSKTVFLMWRVEVEIIIYYLLP